MAPENRKPKRKAKENQFPFDLGVKGRKTGLTLPQLGERDENGLEPMDHLFSSPENPDNIKSNGIKRTDTTLSEEEDMDVVESTIPGPDEALAERQKLNVRLPPPKSKSPIKTFLHSPARRNASLGPTSSPARGSIMESKVISSSASVKRKLEFSKVKPGSSKYNRGTTNERPPKQIMHSSLSISEKNSSSRHITRDSTPEYFTNEDQENVLQDDVEAINGKGSYQMETDQDDDSDAPVDESEASPEIQVVKKGKKKAREIDDAKLLKKARRKKADRANLSAAEESEAEEERPTKRSRHSTVHSVNHQSATGKKEQAMRNKAHSKLKITAAKAFESPQIQRGPPLPRGKGLLILRRETPEDSHGILRTRSGRNSIKPLAFWSNEKVEFEDGELSTKDLTADFAGRKIKHVIRAEEIVRPRKKGRGKSRALKYKKRNKAVEQDSDEDDDDDDEIEPWEADPGRIIADVRNWDPDDPLGSQNDEREEEIALSSAAIITREIVDASFRFAKTLTLPFFGAGMVDLPPGSEKKQKNSRKMQLAFFVFYGKVQVTVNDNVFRISKGGMWQVPRGNFYGIQNDYDRPARIFFSQGCEIVENDGES